MDEGEVSLRMERLLIGSYSTNVEAPTEES